MKTKSKVKYHGLQLPLIVEKAEDGFYVVECPLFDGCYAQGKTLDEALKNIREVITMVSEEESAKRLMRTYHSQELSLHTITL